MVAAAYAVLTLLCGALALNRYDAVVALTVATTLLFLTLRRPLAAGVSVGLGFALKLTPALLLPLLLVLQESRGVCSLVLAGVHRWPPSCRGCPSCLKDPGHCRTAVHPTTPSGRSSWRACSAHRGRRAPLAGSAHPTIVHAFGSQNYAGGRPDAVAALSPWLMVLAVGAVYALVWRRRLALRTAPQLPCPSRRSPSS